MVNRLEVNEVNFHQQMTGFFLFVDGSIFHLKIEAQKSEDHSLCSDTKIYTCR